MANMSSVLQYRPVIDSSIGSFGSASLNPRILKINWHTKKNTCPRTVCQFGSRTDRKKSSSGLRKTTNGKMQLLKHNHWLKLKIRFTIFHLHVKAMFSAAVVNGRLLHSNRTNDVMSSIIVKVETKHDTNLKARNRLSTEQTLRIRCYSLDSFVLPVPSFQGHKNLKPNLRIFLSSSR